jgi:hypothetical protein
MDNGTLYGRHLHKVAANVRESQIGRSGKRPVKFD